jgi:hypothetical protein
MNLKGSGFENYYYYYYLFKLQMDFYPVTMYYNKTQRTNNTPHSNNNSTQNYTNNKGHTTHNEYNANAITTTTNTIKTSLIKNKYTIH